MKLLIIFSFFLILNACGSNSSTGRSAGPTSLNNSDFPNEAGQIFGIWQSKIGTQNHPTQRLYFNRQGKFAIALECDDGVGNVWATALTNAEITTNSIALTTDISAEAKEQNGSSCGFAIKKHQFYYSVNGDQLSTFASDGSGKENYYRIY